MAVAGQVTADAREDLLLVPKLDLFQRETVRVRGAECACVAPTLPVKPKFGNYHVISWPVRDLE